MSGSDVLTAVVRGAAPYAILGGAAYIGYRVLKKNGIIDGIFNAPQVITKTITDAVKTVLPDDKPQWVEMTNPNPIINDFQRGAQELKDWGDALQAAIPGDWNVKSDPIPQDKLSWSDFAKSLNKAPWQVVEEYKQYLAD